MTSDKAQEKDACCGRGEQRKGFNLICAQCLSICQERVGGAGAPGANKLSLGAFPTEGSGQEEARAFQVPARGPHANTRAPFRLKEHPVILSFNHDSPPVAVPNAARFSSLRGLVANESPFELRSWEIAVRTEKHKKNSFIQGRIVAAITV